MNVGYLKAVLLHLELQLSALLLWCKQYVTGEACEMRTEPYGDSSRKRLTYLIRCTRYPLKHNNKKH